MCSLIDWLESLARLVNVLLSRALEKWDTGKNIQIEKGMRVSWQCQGQHEGQTMGGREVATGNKRRKAMEELSLISSG